MPHLIFVAVYCICFVIPYLLLVLLPNNLFGILGSWKGSCCRGIHLALLKMQPTHVGLLSCCMPRTVACPKSHPKMLPMHFMPGSYFARLITWSEAILVLLGCMTTLLHFSEPTLPPPPGSSLPDSLPIWPLLLTLFLGLLAVACFLLMFGSLCPPPNSPAPTSPATPVPVATPTCGLLATPAGCSAMPATALAI